MSEKKKWTEEISPVQQKVLQMSNIVGVVMFFIGVQFVVRGKSTLGSILSGVGMFIAVQMKWGMDAVFGWLEGTKLLEKMGYSKLFWWVIVAAYVVDCIGLGLLLNFVQ